MEPDTQAYTSVDDLNAIASTNLSAKLSHVRIPRRCFPEGLSINEIYSSSSRTRTPRISKELQLPFIFAHHNSLFRANRFARKPATQLEYNVVRALWYWSVSRHHSFAHTYKHVRLNIAVIAVVLSRPDAQHLVSPGAIIFMQAFMDAWLENLHRPSKFTEREAFLQLWTTGPFDLMCFRRSQVTRWRRYCKSALKRLDALQGRKRLIVPSGRDDFVAFMQRLDVEQVGQLSGALGMRWMFESVNLVNAGKAKAKDETGLEGLFADCGLSKPST
jgi:hypothetical protein